MRIAYKPNYSHFVAANNLRCKKRKPLLKWTPQIIGGAVGITSVVAIAAGTQLVRDKSLIVYGAIIAVAGIVQLFGSFVYPLVLRRQLYTSNQLHHSELIIDIEEQGIRISSPTMTIAYAWQAISEWYESRQVFVLAVSYPTFLWFPKACFTPGQLLEFQKLLAQHCTQG